MNPTPLYSTSTPLEFHIFGRPARCTVLPRFDCVSYNVTSDKEPEDMPTRDFLRVFGDAPLHIDYPELGSVGLRVYTLKTASDALCALYTMGDAPMRPEVAVVAEWREENHRVTRVQDSFGGHHYFRFAQDGSVSMSEHTTWRAVKSPSESIASA